MFGIGTMSDTKPADAPTCVASWQGDSYSLSIYESSDNLRLWADATVTAGETHPVFPELGLQHIENTLQELKFREDIHNTVTSFLEELHRVPRTMDMVAVATATPAVVGEDASIEWVVDNPDGASEEERQEAAIQDLYASTTWVKVELGQHLFWVHPEVPGQDGVDLHGAVIAAPPVAASPVALGDNCKKPSDGRDGAVAAKAGVVRVTANVISVETAFEVRGDLTLDIGNIDFNGSVLIRGDVPSGFVVKATGDVAIGGRVQSVQIEAGGDVRITLGVFGDGKATLRAGGNVEAKYLSETTVRAEGNLVVKKEILDCDIAVGGTISASTISGGSAFARLEIETGVVGSQAGKETLLVLGFRPGVVKKVKRILEKINRLDEELHNVALRGGEQMDNPPGDLPKPVRSWLAGLRAKRKKCQSEKDEQASKLEKLMEVEDGNGSKAPAITITRQRHAGLTAQIGGCCRKTFEHSEIGRHVLSGDVHQRSISVSKKKKKGR
jgi:uncharacterized protein (DUF342 family)